MSIMSKKRINKMNQGNTTVADAISGTTTLSQPDPLQDGAALSAETAPADQAGEVVEKLDAEDGENAAIEGAAEEVQDKPAEAPVEVPPVVAEEVKAPEVVAAPVAAPVAPVAPIVLAEKAPAVDTLAAPEASAEEKYLEDIRATGSPLLKRILGAIETFVEQMKPRTPITPEKGSTYQYEFLKHLLWLIERDYEEFRLGWNLLLVYFTVHHGKNTPASYTALSEYSTHRFLNNWTRGEDQCDAYRNLIVLLRATHNKKTRAHDIKTIMLDKVAPSVISQKGLDNLKKFYEV